MEANKAYGPPLKLNADDRQDNLTKQTGPFI